MKEAQINWASEFTLHYEILNRKMDITFRFTFSECDLQIQQFPIKTFNSPFTPANAYLR
jgi:hypothetical protein